MCNCSCHPEDFPSLAEIQKTQRRFFVFIARLKARLCGYADAALPDLLQAHAADTDPFKRPSQRQKAAFYGQMESILSKARDVLDEEVIDFPFRSDDSVMAAACSTFRSACYAEFLALEAVANDYREQLEQVFS